MRNKVGNIKRILISAFTPVIPSVLNLKTGIAALAFCFPEVLPVRGDISFYACALVNIDILHEGVLSYVDGILSARQCARKIIVFHHRAVKLGCRGIIFVRVH